ncbi:MAG: glycerol-3-phosphate acyltransferase [Thermodesulfobacteriota bacterium]
MTGGSIISVLVFPAAYLAGSINFSILVMTALGLGDPRDKFSGNPGVTNVSRQAGLPWAVAVLALDLGRAMLVAVLGLHFLPRGLWPALGLALLSGNRYPLFHGFRGGKGVANYLGFTLVIAPWAALIGSLGWLAGHRLTKLPFIGSFCLITILGLGTMQACGWEWPAVLGTVGTLIFIIYAHKSNIVQTWGRNREANRHSDRP